MRRVDGRGTRRDGHRAPDGRLALATLLVLGTTIGAAASDSTGTGTPVREVRSLDDLRTLDATQSAAACPAVTFDDARSDGAVADDRSILPNPSGTTPVEVALFVLAIDSIDSSTKNRNTGTRLR